jgi:hypothetical protein
VVDSLCDVLLELTFVLISLFRNKGPWELVKWGRKGAAV